MPSYYRGKWCDLNLNIFRSVDFEVYHSLFNLEMLSWRDIRLTLGLMQMLWDPAETAGIFFREFSEYQVGCTL